MGKVLPTDLENIFEKNEMPAVPPGIFTITVQSNEMI